MLAEMFHEAGYPPGCFNVVTGEGRGVGMALVRHPIPRKVAFTGGGVGRQGDSGAAPAR